MRIGRLLGRAGLLAALVGGAFVARAQRSRAVTGESAEPADAPVAKAAPEIPRQMKHV
jgi:hypothetical protein